MSRAFVFSSRGQDTDKNMRQLQALEPRLDYLAFGLEANTNTLRGCFWTKTPKRACKLRVSLGAFDVQVMHAPPQEWAHQCGSGVSIERGVLPSVEEFHAQTRRTSRKKRVYINRRHKLQPWLKDWIVSHLPEFELTKSN